eukprot:30234-Prorocentrum_minimum.AAC.3
MGVWMLGASAGLLFAGMLGATYRAVSHPAFFATLAAIASVNGAHHCLQCPTRRSSPPSPPSPPSTVPTTAYSIPPGVLRHPCRHRHRQQCAPLPILSHPAFFATLTAIATVNSAHHCLYCPTRRSSPPSPPSPLSTVNPKNPKSLLCHPRRHRRRQRCAPLHQLACLAPG